MFQTTAWCGWISKYNPSFRIKSGMTGVLFYLKTCSLRRFIWSRIMQIMMNYLLSKHFPNFFRGVSVSHWNVSFELHPWIRKMQSSKNPVALSRGIHHKCSKIYTALLEIVTARKLPAIPNTHPLLVNTPFWSDRLLGRVFMPVHSVKQPKYSNPVCSFLAYFQE